ncbi:MAG: membrane protein insertase YidC [Steroidobacteraceae bacterium]
MRNNIRMFLWLLLGLALWFNFETWQRDQLASQSASASTGTDTPAAAQASASNPGTDAPASTTSLSEDVPVVADAPTPEAAAPAAAAADETSAGKVELNAGTVRVSTDVLDLTISLRGGALINAELPRYPLVKGGDQPVELFNQHGAGSTYTLQTGLTGPTQVPHPTHIATFTADAPEYRLMTGSDELRVPLRWTDASGVTVTKTFTFRRGSYRIDLDYAVTNRSNAAWSAASYAQIVRQDPPVKRSMFNVESYAFRGPAYWDGKKYQKLKINKEEDLNLERKIQGGWIAGMQHHFVSAVVPDAQGEYAYRLKAGGIEYQLSVVGPTKAIAAGATGQFHETLFVGPKLQKQLDATGPDLDRVADYGMLTVLAKPLFWALNKAHSVLGNWGLAIIVITFLLKLAFYPLSEASGKSMARMRTMAPRIKALQETYKDDREKLGRAMMEMYQREKINPLAGCLPMLVQMPVFFAFYWVLLESVEMRQAPFYGWLTDLSSRDPFFILPAIMAAAMFVQYKLNPAPPDPVQAKVFAILPFVMSITFAFFPAGLVLYWVTNTILSIAQQWNINRRIEASEKARAT